MKQQEFQELLASLDEKNLKIYQELFKDWDKFDEELYERNCKKFGVNP